MFRKLARIVLTGLMLASLALAAWNGWQLWNSPLGGMLVMRSEAEISARLERLLAREVTPEALDSRLTRLLAETPRDWAAIDAITVLAREQGVSPSAKVLAALATADGDDRSLADRARDCAACAWDPANCDLSAIALCQVGVALLPFGDAVSIVRESGHLVAGQEVDTLDLTLSTVGLAATVVAPATAGASAFVKAGAGLTRAANRMGALSQPIANTIRAAARSGIDWSLVAKVRPGAGITDQIAAAVKPRLLRPAVEFMEDTGSLVTSAGTRDAIFLLSKAENARDAKVLASVAKPLGRRAAGTVEIAGTRRLRGIIFRYADEAVWLAGSLASALTALAALGFAAFKSVTLRLLRGLAR